MNSPALVTSRENPLVQRLLKLAARPAAYRKLEQVWIEGEHLCLALLQRGWRVAHALISQEAWETRADWRQHFSALEKVTQVPQDLFNRFSTLESPSFVGLLIDLDEINTMTLAAPSAASRASSGSDTEAPDAARRRTEPASNALPTVVLDRLQDPGNVGSILRSASALGFSQVIALQDTAALWSPKVLRAGMGAHFALRLFEGWAPADISALGLPLVVASSHAHLSLHEGQLPWPCAWVLGHEGQGVCAELMEQAAMQVRIPQPGGEESLNVAAAAAICLYESMRQSTLR